MLKRQKTLLWLLKVANRSVSRFELTKWSFLLRHELPAAGGASFYDFVPYQYGPFSFTLYQELDKLEAMSYVRRIDDSSCLLDRKIAGNITVDDKSVQRDIARLIDSHGRKSTGQLTDYVYERFPRFTCNSRIRQLLPRPTADPAVFTAGYEGRSIDGFLDLLVLSGIRRLIDVRRNPIARRYGFHRSTLNRLCQRLDIEYVHFPSLGVLSENRQNLRTAADYHQLFVHYKEKTLQEEVASIDEVSTLMQNRPSVLVCMEHDPAFCHRSVLAEAVSQHSGLPIRNLGCSHGQSKD